MKLATRRDRGTKPIRDDGVEARRHLPPVYLSELLPVRTLLKAHRMNCMFPPSLAALALFGCASSPSPRYANGVEKGTREEAAMSAA